MQTRLIIAFALTPLVASCIFATEVEYDCGYYCGLMETSCDETYQKDGEFDFDFCLEECASFVRLPAAAPGFPESLGDRVPNSDTLECRAYHANNASRDKPNGVHCAHADIGGADTCVGPCAEYCLGTGNPDFNGVSEDADCGDVFTFDVDECLDFCNTLPRGSEGDLTGNTSDCRLTYARQIAGSRTRDLTCQLASEASPACAGGDIANPLPLPDGM